MFRAVGNRCAVDITELSLPLTREEILPWLIHHGFGIIEIDLIALARQSMRQASYRRGARLHEAPEVFDCSSLTKWLYGQRGIWLPRRSIQQRDYGQHIELTNISSGDLVFTTGWKNYFHDDPADGVGHVGIATADKTIIHAANSQAGVIETPLEQFIAEGCFRGARKIITTDQVVTLLLPPNREIETSDDLRWIILQSL